MELYRLLGVAKTASVEEIKKSYRRLAKQHHPDIHPGDAKNERHFKDISAAYAILGDADKRRQYDQGSIDAQGNPTGFGGSGFRGQGGHARQQRPSDDDIFDSDLFNDIFRTINPKGGRPGAGSGAGSAKSSDTSLDIQQSLTISFLEAALGTKKRVQIAPDRVVEVTVPPGVEEAQVLRLKGQGRLSGGFGAPGDALVRVMIQPHVALAREGLNIISTIPVTLLEALDGASIPVQTIHAKVALKIPPQSNADTMLRLRGQGVHAAEAKGDHLVRLKIVLPEAIDKDLAEAIRKAALRNPYTVRKDD
ncbi:MAG: DnaJ C-terminal domain-containing protein [Holosporales bacterium]|jgi:DnaJ-class molecular chaperone